jgi:hypothetical protein
MRKLHMNTVFTAAILLTVLFNHSANAQAFTKGSLVISVSEGVTYSNYMTASTTYRDVITRNVNGDRDPLIIEYGLSDHWGISLTWGGDIYRVDPTTFYRAQTNGSVVKAITGDFTVDANYHFYVTKRVDLSGFGSLGLAGISIKGNEGDRAYQYSAGGGIMRLGAKAKYYVLKRFGIMGMFSAFSTGMSPAGVKDNTIAREVTTSITGCALEFGLCYRVLR